MKLKMITLDFYAKEKKVADDKGVSIREFGCHDHPKAALNAFLDFEKQILVVACSKCERPLIQQPIPGAI